MEVVGEAQLIADVSGGPATPIRIQSLLRDALGDPLLTLAVRDPASGDYVDAEGDAVELPVDRADLGVTSVERDGQPVAVLIHDAAIQDGELTKCLATVSFMLLEHAHLVEELRSSRARFVADAQRERLRVEGNLHDGTQGRLLDIQIRLEAARELATDERLVEELRTLAADTAAAVEDLRAVARGLYPTVLRERGLPDALRSVARGAATPVTIVDRGVPRCDSTVEEAIYYCVLEAIQNSTKHAGGHAQVTVVLEPLDASLEFSIMDAGAGFDPSRDTGGIGMLSMRDRIGAVGGELVVASEPGRGTTVRGIVPVAGSANGSTA